MTYEIVDYGPAVERPIVNMEWTDKGERKVIFDEGAALALLLQKEIAFLNSFWWEKACPEHIQKAISVSVVCNDTFCYASSDAEGLSYDQIKPLYEMWVRDPDYGSMVWCMVQRRMLPLDPYHVALSKHWNLDTFKAACASKEAMDAWVTAEMSRTDKRVATNSVENLILEMKALTDEQRMDVMNHFCKHCGTVEADTSRGCQCWNDE